MRPSGSSPGSAAAVVVGELCVSGRKAGLTPVIIPLLGTRTPFSAEPGELRTAIKGLGRGGGRKGGGREGGGRKREAINESQINLHYTHARYYSKRTIIL
jgi:hypothetical protein